MMQCSLSFAKSVDRLGSVKSFCSLADSQYR